MEDRELLTPEDEKFIVENYSKMSVLQIALRLGIKTVNRKCPIISEFVDRANLESKTQESSSVIVDGTKPSNEVVPSVEAAKIIVSESLAVENPPPEVDEDIGSDAFVKLLQELGFSIHSPLSEREKRDITFLRKQMGNTRYTLMYRAFRKTDYKRLFKEEFIRSMFSKGEMPVEEVNDFMDLANESVMQYDIKCKVKELEEMRDKTQAPALKVSLEQVIADQYDKYGGSVKRASDIKKTLGASREQRLKENRAIGLTVASLIEAVCDSEKKVMLVKLQNQKDLQLRKTLKELEILADSKAIIMGISPDEILDGAL